MFVVDTNVLVYAANRDAPEHSQCRALLESWRPQATPWYLTWGIVYEFLRVVTHPKVIHPPRPIQEAWEFVRSVMASPALEVLTATGRHPLALEKSITEVPLLGGNLVHDTHTAVLMREHGVSRIVTRDNDFHRFGWVEVVDPLTLRP